MPLIPPLPIFLILRPPPHSQPVRTTKELYRDIKTRYLVHYYGHTGAGVRVGRKFAFLSRLGTKSPETFVQVEVHVFNKSAAEYFCSMGAEFVNKLWGLRYQIVHTNDLHIHKKDRQRKKWAEGEELQTKSKPNVAETAPRKEPFEDEFYCSWFVALLLWLEGWQVDQQCIVCCRHSVQVLVSDPSYLIYSIKFP